MNVNGTESNATNLGTAPTKFPPITDQTFEAQRTKESVAVEKTGPQNQDASSKGKKITRDEAEKFIESMSDLTDILNTTLNFAISEETDNIVVNVINRETKEIVRQIPPEEVQRLRSRMAEMTGILLNENV